MNFFSFVSTHSRPKAAGDITVDDKTYYTTFQHTAARRWLAPNGDFALKGGEVSTHSRPKAAGFASQFSGCSQLFQHTAARRRLAQASKVNSIAFKVSTHSRPKAAGLCKIIYMNFFSFVSTHSRPKAAGDITVDDKTYYTTFQHTAARRWLAPNGDFALKGGEVSTHSRPKAAGVFQLLVNMRFFVSTHSRPKAAGFASQFSGCSQLFQHTAARRRLAQASKVNSIAFKVSTHSRPKAAGSNAPKVFVVTKVSTHSRPKAAGFEVRVIFFGDDVSTHSRPKAAGIMVKLG